MLNRYRRFAGLLALVGSASAVACTAFSSADNGGPAAVDGGDEAEAKSNADGGLTDGASSGGLPLPAPDGGSIPSDASEGCAYDGGTDPSDYWEEDFSGAGCDGFQLAGGSNGTLERVTVECGYACHVCVVQTDSDGVITLTHENMDLATSMPSGAPLTLSVWTRDDPDASTGEGASFDFYPSFAGEVIDDVSGFTPDWHESTKRGTYTGNAPVPESYINVKASNAPVGSCFYIGKMRIESH